MAGVLAEGLKRQYTEFAAAAVADALRKRKEKVVSDTLLAALESFEPTWLIAREHVFSALGGRNEPRITTVLLDNLQNAEDEGIKESCAGPWPWKEVTRSPRPSSERSRPPTSTCCEKWRREPRQARRGTARPIAERHRLGPEEGPSDGNAGPRQESRRQGSGADREGQVAVPITLRRAETTSRGHRA